MPIKRASKNDLRMAPMERFFRGRKKQDALEKKRIDIEIKLDVQLQNIPVKKRLDAWDIEYWPEMVKWLTKEAVSEVCNVVGPKKKWLGRFVDACYKRHEGNNYSKKN